MASASGTVCPWSVKLPTAVQAVVDGHDTATRLLARSVGVCWIAQRPAIQRSASCPVDLCPTATQIVFEGHATPSSEGLSASAWKGLVAGAFWIDHRAPSQRSINCPSLL